MAIAETLEFVLKAHKSAKFKTNVFKRGIVFFIPSKGLKSKRRADKRWKEHSG